MQLTQVLLQADKARAAIGNQGMYQIGLSTRQSQLGNGPKANISRTVVVSFPSNLEALLNPNRKVLPAHKAYLVVKAEVQRPETITMSNTATTAKSRAVVRVIEPGCAATCITCDLPVKFIARVNGRQVIANVYEEGRWMRVEHFHEECYQDAERPYGEPG